MSEDHHATLQSAIDFVLTHPGNAQYKGLNDRLDEVKRCTNARHRIELWEEAGTFAAYGLQVDNLHLSPWESPPCMVSDPEAILEYSPAHRQFRAAKLLLEMRRYGISDWHHDPLKAIAEAKK